MNETKEVTVAFPKKESGLKRVLVPLKEFVDNTRVMPFIKEDERELWAHFEELWKAGVKGIIHIINRGSRSGEEIARAIPDAIRNSNFYIPVHYFAREAGDWEKIERNPSFFRLCRKRTSSYHPATSRTRDEGRARRADD